MEAMEEEAMTHREVEVDTCREVATIKAVEEDTKAMARGFLLMATSARGAKRKVIMSMTVPQITIRITIPIGNRECLSPPSISWSF
jgi:hypothetical protein